VAQPTLKIVNRDSAKNVQKYAPAHNNYLGMEWTIKNGFEGHGETR